MDEVETVFERWKATLGYTRARMDAKRAKAIRDRLRDGYTVEDLELAIFGCSVSDFHQGQNDRSTRYDDIALICRDAEHVDRFIATAEKKIARQVASAAKPAEPQHVRTKMPESVRALIAKKIEERG